MFILLDILGWLLPIILIVWLIRAAGHRGDKNKKDHREASYRDLMLGLVAVSAGYAGIFAIYYLPPALLGTGDNKVFAGRLILGVAFLAAGLMMKHVTGVFLMIMGLAALVMSSPFVFQNLGSTGALAVAALAFAVLVFFALKMGKKAETHG